MAVSPIFFAFFRSAGNVLTPAAKLFSKKCSRGKKCRKEWPYEFRFFGRVIYCMAAYQAMCFSLLGSLGNKTFCYLCDISKCYHDQGASRNYVRGRLRIFSESVGSVFEKCHANHVACQLSPSVCVLVSHSGLASGLTISKKVVREN